MCLCIVIYMCGRLCLCVHVWRPKINIQIFLCPACSLLVSPLLSSPFHSFPLSLSAPILPFSFFSLSSPPLLSLRWDLPLNPGLAITLDWLASETQYLPVPTLPPVLGLQMNAAVPRFHVCSGHVHSDPHGYSTSILYTGPSLSNV